MEAVPDQMHHPELLAGTADPRGPGEGSAETADPLLAATADLLECGEDDSDDGFYWDGSSDNWASVYSTALGLANPVP